jgi:hypothetical protein
MHVRGPLPFTCAWCKASFSPAHSKKQPQRKNAAASSTHYQTKSLKKEKHAHIQKKTYKK